MSVHRIFAAAFVMLSVTAGATHVCRMNVAAAAEPRPPALKGRFLYDGPPPRPAPSRFDEIRLDRPPAREPGTGRLSGVEIAYREYLQRGIRPRTTDDSLLVNPEGGLANVVVYVTSEEIAWPMADTKIPPTVTLEIKNGQFVPRVQAVLANQSLNIVNRDEVPFNFCFDAIQNSPVNFVVNPGAERRHSFSTSEKMPLPFRSNQQIWAKGILLIHRNPYAAVSGTDGVWTIPALPPGRWNFAAWHERAGYLKSWPRGRFTYEVKPGENDLGTVKLSPEMFNRQP